jgi:guanosine-3',5'-bis(diphosphate) 3'-pyrophosphohydrolase
VATLIADVGHVDDIGILQAALLHDTVEDTETTFEELNRAFGPDVTELVREMTDDKRLPKPERKRLQVEHAPSLSDRAKVIKLADKTSNIGDIMSNRPDGWSTDRCRKYVEWGQAVIAGCRGVNQPLEDLVDATVEQAWDILGRA